MQILIALVALFICSDSVLAVSQTSSFRFLEKPGPHPVGLKIVDQYDGSRTYSSSPTHSSKPSFGNLHRPLQTLVWYPSMRNIGKPMTVGDYTQLADTEIRSDRWTGQLVASSRKGLNYTSPLLVTFAPFFAKQSCVGDLTKICRLRHGSTPTRKLVFLEITN